MKKNKEKICIITLTYNRPDYIKKSFKSLYEKFGANFDHYVFDDGSDVETKNILKDLKKKYKFNLKFENDNLGIGNIFLKNIRNIKDKYDYYIKHDSDIEILTDNIFKHIKDIFEYEYEGKTICGITPRCEGMYTFQKRPDDVEFYNGHVIRPKTSTDIGAFMVIRGDIFNDFIKTHDYAFDKKQKFGIDSELYKHCVDFGLFIIIEDISVYQIDNFWGQRKDFEYFTKRNRWCIIDIEYPWMIKLSKELYPKIIPYEYAKKIIRFCESYDDFKYKIITYCEQPQLKVIYDESQKNIEPKLMEKVTKTLIYRIIFPENFAGSSKEMKRGEIRYVENVPEWAKNNPALVVENIFIDLADKEKYLQRSNN